MFELTADEKGKVLEAYQDLVDILPNSMSKDSKEKTVYLD